MYGFIVTQCTDCEAVFIADAYGEYRDPNTWKRIDHCPGCGVLISADGVVEIPLPTE